MSDIQKRDIQSNVWHFTCMVTITVPQHSKEKSFSEIVDSLPTIHHAWLLMDILAIGSNSGSVVGDQLCDSAYAKEGVLQNYLEALASRGYVRIFHSH